MFGLYNKNKLFKIGKVALEFCQRRIDGDLALCTQSPSYARLKTETEAEKPGSR